MGVGFSTTNEPTTRTERDTPNAQKKFTPKTLNSKNSIKKQPTRKSMDLDEAMKHFARTSARCCDKARSGRDPWVNGGALE